MRYGVFRGIQQRLFVTFSVVEVTKAVLLVFRRFLDFCVPNVSFYKVIHVQKSIFSEL